MATVEKHVERQTEQRFILHHVDWETYDRLLSDIGDRPSLRVTYDRGTLELMSPSPQHENLNQLIARMVYALSEELDIVVMSFGSTTWRRQDLDRGLEADSCYYITNEPAVRGRLELDLRNDPPPDLAIEVQVSKSAINKLGIYAALGVPEVWLHDTEELRVLQLDSNRAYHESPHSAFFPPAALDGIRQFLSQNGLPNETAWIKNFRRWVRENLVR